MKKLVLVVGSGRSGTSAITRALQVLGVDLGDTLMPANPEFNKKGYFEDLEVFEFNNRLFERIGSVWHDLNPVDLRCLARCELQDRCIDLLTRKLDKKEVFGLKDPQISRIIPFWSDVAHQIDVADHYVIALRHPLSVARSLSRYTGFSIARCFEIWYTFTLDALNASVSGRRVVISYENILRSPAAEISRIAKVIGVPFDRSSALFRTYSESFLDSADNRNGIDVISSEDSQDLPVKVEKLYDFAAKLAGDELDIDSPEAQETISKFQDLRKNDLSLVRLVSELDVEIARFEHDFQVASETIQSLIVDRDAYKAVVEDQMPAEIAARDNKIFELERIVSELSSMQEVNQENSTVVGRVLARLLRR
ncbi:MAG: sulfotransferase family protein [Paracoccaceae bacterium]